MSLYGDDEIVLAPGDLLTEQLARGRRPMTPRDRLDDLLGVDAEEYGDAVMEPEAEEFRGNRFLEALGETLPETPRGDTFLSGLLFGAAGGLARRGRAISKRRAEFEKDAAARRTRRDEEAIRASRELRQARRGGEAALAREFRQERRALEREGREEAARAARENVPATEALLAERPWLRRQGVKVGDPVPRSVAFDAPPAATQEPLVVVQTESGPQYVPRSQAVGKAPPKREAPLRPPTGEERKNLGFFQRGTAAVDAITSGGVDSVEEKIARSPVAQLRGQLPDALNFLKGADQQVYQQALRQFAEAHLRRESGAVISEKEMRDVASTYFVQPGDSPRVIANKKRARADALNAIRIGAGRAYDEFYSGAPAQPNALSDDEAYQEYLREVGGQ